MKNILSKIEFHYTYLIMILGFVLTGHFINVIVFTLIILFHELGHIITSILFGYKIDKVIIYPYGGVTKVNTLVNTKIEEDLVVAVAGIIMQSIFFLFIMILYNAGYIREYVFNLFVLYNKGIFIFNLLPIIPLDGSRISYLILSKIFYFRLSSNLVVVISLCMIVILLYSNIYEKGYSIFMMIGVCLYNIYEFYKDISFVYNKFLLERYLYKIKFKKEKLITSIDRMYKNYSHYIKCDNMIMKEEEYLENIFKKK